MQDVIATTHDMSTEDQNEKIICEFRKQEFATWDHLMMTSAVLNTHWL